MNTTHQTTSSRALAEELRPLLGQLTLMLRKQTGHLEVTPSQSAVLLLLLDGPRRMSDLSQYVGVSGPSMTVLVDRMERQGWVERQPEPTNRRAIQVRITSSGREMVVRARAIWTESLAARLDALTPSQRSVIAAALPALAALADIQHEGT